MVYMRNSKAISELTQVQEHDSIPSNEVINFYELQDKMLNQKIEDDLYITKKCTKQPLYPFSNYLSFQKFPLTCIAFLTNLNATSIPTNVF